MTLESKDHRRRSVFSVDVEDWFHILAVPGTPRLAEWDALPSRVERNFLRLLDLMAKHNATSTCFFLGWVAERFPHLVKEAAARGHEIASHGYAHRLVYELSRAEFLEDASRARKILEDVAGRSVEGYRAAGFSVRKQTPWFFDALIEAGYRYDSSLCPVGYAPSDTRREPHRIVRGGAELFEFPVSVTDFLGGRMCFSGGGYLRLFPLSLIRRMSRRVLDEGRPVVFYIHPREIDPPHPRVAMNALRRFKSYVNLSSTEPKLDRILAEFPVTSFRSWMDQEMGASPLRDAVPASQQR